MVCSSPVTWSATGSSSPAAGADLYKRLRKTAAEETRLRKMNFLKKISLIFFQICSCYGDGGSR